MPPKVKISREEVLQAAIETVRKKGIGAVNARDLARELSCSTQPIFFNFSSMSALREALCVEVNALYNAYITREMESGIYPPYKASGMAYIRFASEEKELFKLLFMRDRTEEVLPSGADRELEPLLALIEKQVGISREEARLFHLEMWVTVHGIATMTATDYLALDTELVSRILTDTYLGLCARYASREV